MSLARSAVLSRSDRATLPATSGAVQELERTFPIDLVQTVEEFDLGAVTDAEWQTSGRLWRIRRQLIRR